jgi:glucokinase
MNQRTNLIGVDMGGTKILAGKIESQQIAREFKMPTPAGESEQIVVQALISAIEQVFDHTCEGIGIGVPSVVETEKGIVYDVLAIPSWKEVHLKEQLESHFCKPVFVNNDSNCFALGEKYFGKGKKYKNLVGITLGTGLGAGIIVNNKLYNGSNCGAGEFGCIPYKGSILEDYCSSHFFKSNYGLEGHLAFQLAKDGDQKAREIFNDFGKNIGFAIKIIMLSVDPEAILIGGSISEAFPFFRQSMLDSLADYPYSHSVKQIAIEKSELKGAAILGAGALFYDNEFL